MSQDRARLETLLQEIERDRRKIDATTPLIRNAINDTNNAFIAVENKTLRAILGPLLGIPPSD